MIKKDVTIKDSTEIKALVFNIGKAHHPVYAVRGELKVDAKNILGLLSIDPSQTFTLIFDEEDKDLF